MRPLIPRGEVKNCGFAQLSNWLNYLHCSYLPVTLSEVLMIVRLEARRLFGMGILSGK